MSRSRTLIILQLLFLVFYLFVNNVEAQENAFKKIPEQLLECYSNNDLHPREKQLPKTIDIFIDIIRKIEDYPNLNMDLRTVTATILQRFRQDGIIRDPDVTTQEIGINPFKPRGPQFFRHEQVLKLIPSNNDYQLNHTISHLEKCSLHTMISSSIDLYQRIDDPILCGSQSNNFNRFSRSIKPDQLRLKKRSNYGNHNYYYSPTPSNFNRRAENQMYEKSSCPAETGIFYTPWGSVAGGSLLAGIAAGLERQAIPVSTLARKSVLEERNYDGSSMLENIYLATLAGDLAEVLFAQGAHSLDNFKMAIQGAWNSSVLQKWYTLSANKDLEMTDSEFRGDLDGLILGSLVQEYSQKYNNLKLSQILDMYYGNRGFGKDKIKACSRTDLFSQVTNEKILEEQTYSAALLLSENLAKYTITADAIRNLARRAVKQLFSMRKGIDRASPCETEMTQSEVKVSPSVDLKIVIDFQMEYKQIIAVIYEILRNIQVNKYNSNYAIINGQNGDMIINTTHSLSDLFVQLNETRYLELKNGGILAYNRNTRNELDFAKVMNKLLIIQKNKMRDEQKNNLGGAGSDVTLFIARSISYSPADGELLENILKEMREEVPDAKLIFANYGQSITFNRKYNIDDKDVVTLVPPNHPVKLVEVKEILERILKVPKRLINSQCGADYKASGTQSSKYNGYIEPGEVHHFRIHPNYFFSSDNPTLKIKPPSSRTYNKETIRVYYSREDIEISSLTQRNKVELNNNEYSINLNCGDAKYIHQCQPFYIAIVSEKDASSTSNQCLNNKCRYPTMMEYVISYERLVCKSNAAQMILVSLIHLLLLYCGTRLLY